MNNRWIYLIFVIIVIGGCIYEGGNIGTVLSFNTNVKSNIILEMTDRLHSKNKFVVPDSLEYIVSFDDYNHLNYRIYYFNELPQEIYFITFQGNLSVRYIYSFKEKAWIGRKTGIGVNQSERIRKRVISEILPKIIEEAKLGRYEDEDIYVNLEKCENKIMCGSDEDVLE